MIFYCAFFILNVIGSFGAHQPDIDINRLRRLPNEVRSFHSSSYYYPGRRSIGFDQVRRSNDYDDYTGGLSEPHTLLQTLYSPPTAYQKNAVKIHQPRENPKLYYQSDAYIKEVNAKNVDHDVIATYPGREVIRVSEYRNPSLLPRKTRNKENMIYPVFEQCIRCPPDRTLVSQAGSDRVLLQAPRLVTCSGHIVSDKVKFVHMYGPKFGSHVKRGSHVVVGRITLNGETLRLCKVAVHVIVQSCPVPKYLVPHCDQHNKSCTFSCRDPKLEVIGETSLVCGNDMEWENELPLCKARTWCQPPMVPEQGRFRCKGNEVEGGVGLEEGTKCRLRCGSQWRPYPRNITVCRRGAWTHNLQCQQKSRHPK